MDGINTNPLGIHPRIGSWGLGLRLRRAGRNDHQTAGSMDSILGAGHTNGTVAGHGHPTAGGL